MNVNLARDIIAAMTEAKRSCLYALVGMAVDSNRKSFEEIAKNCKDMRLPYPYSYYTISTVLCSMTEPEIDMVKFMVAQAIVRREKMYGEKNNIK